MAIQVAYGRISGFRFGLSPVRLEIAREAAMLGLTRGRPGVSRARTLFVLLAVAMLAGCGINTIPTLQERAKAAWSEVLNGAKS